MATKKEIDEHLKKALKQIGAIKPIFDKEVGEWVFSSPLYPVEYGGNTKEEVIENYPRYLREFIKHRLDARLHPLIEKKTKGRGGKRPGAGRPRGTKKASPTKVIRLENAVAHWIAKHNRLIDLLIFDGHGKYNLFQIEKDEYYGLEDVQENHFSSLARDAKIAFISCNVGILLARMIAAVQNRTVLASKDLVYSNKTYLNECKDCHDVKMHSYDLNGNQIVREFKGNSVFLPCDHVQESLFSRIQSQVAKLFGYT